jgi:hypothetical protein
VVRKPRSRAHLCRLRRDGIGEHLLFGVVLPFVAGVIAAVADFGMLRRRP